jgi:hypothetical protein
VDCSKLKVQLSSIFGRTNPNRKAVFIPKSVALPTQIPPPAKALGLAVPLSILVRADEQIE